MDLDDLVSAHIVTARLGWTRIQVLHVERRRHGFPEPAKTLSRTSLWLWPDVRQWAVEMGWVPWPGPPGADRVMVEPGDQIPVPVVAQRLGLETSEAGDEIVGLEDVSTEQGDGVLYRWEHAEGLWHERANRRPRST